MKKALIAFVFMFFALQSPRFYGATEDPACGAITKHLDTLEQSMKDWPRQRFEKAYKAATLRFGTDEFGTINILGIKIRTTENNADAITLNFALLQLKSYYQKFFYGIYLDGGPEDYSTGMLPVREDLSPEDPDYSQIRKKLNRFRREIRNKLGCRTSSAVSVQAVNQK
jgi:hypothetical protein